MRPIRIVISLVSLFSVFSLPSAYALGPADIFRYFFEWMQDTYFMFFITFVFLLVMFYGIFGAGLKRVKSFQSGDNLSRPGKMVALSIAVISTIGILFVIRSAPRESMEAVLTVMGWFGMAAFSLLIFGISYMNLKGKEKTWPLAFFTTGLGMIVFGLLADSLSWWSFGWTFLIIGLFWFILSGNASSGGGDDGGGRTSPDEPEDPDQTDELTHDFSDQIDRLSQVLSEIETQFTQFKGLCNEMLLIHHEHTRSRDGYDPTPDVSDEMKERYEAMRDGIYDKLSCADQIMREIINDDNYRRISEDHKDAFIGLTERVGGLRVGIIQYHDTFRQKYLDGEAP